MVDPVVAEVEVVVVAEVEVVVVDVPMVVVVFLHFLSHLFCLCTRHTLLQVFPGRERQCLLQTLRKVLRQR